MSSSVLAASPTLAYMLSTGREFSLSFYDDVSKEEYFGELTVQDSVVGLRQLDGCVNFVCFRRRAGSYVVKDGRIQLRTDRELAGRSR